MYRSYAKFGNVDVIHGLKVNGANVGAQEGLGEKFYVNSNTGRDTGMGSVSRPWATLDYALGKCTADKDDEIHLMAGHAETISAAGGVTLDKAGVKIIGHGRYDSRPTFTFTSAGTMLVTAADMAFENCKIVAGVADIAIGILITAKGFRFAYNMMEDVGALNWVDLIHCGAADNDYDGLEIIGNEFVTQDDATVTVIDMLKNNRDVKIYGNKFIGDFNATPFAAVYMADGEIPINIQVIGNWFYNEHNADAVNAVSILEEVGQGWMMHNHCRTLDVAGHTPFLVGAVGIYCSQNYISYAGTDSGFEYPAIGTVA